MYRDPDSGIWIEDLNTKNGTFVNGTTVVRKKVNASDIIMLGGADGHPLNLTQALNKIPLTQQKFQAAFQKLKLIEENYQEKTDHLEVKGEKNRLIIRNLPALILAILTAFLTAFVDENSCVRKYIAIIGSLSSLVLFLVSVKRESINRKKLRTELRELEKEYECTYICQSCGSTLKGKSWDYLDQYGKCPNPHCGRAFK